MSLAGRQSLLYLSVSDPSAGEHVLRMSSRIAISVLGRDFDVSVAIAGPVTTAALAQLRQDLGSTRIVGGLESSHADQPAPAGLRQTMQTVLGTDILNARLQAAIQRKAQEFDFVVVDSLLAWPYRPVCNAPQSLVIEHLYSDSPGSGWLGRLAGSRGLKNYEMAALSTADLVFAPEILAQQLSNAGITVKALRGCFGKPSLSAPTFSDVDYQRTQPRLGYYGYLSDTKNLASLYWFLDNVWPVARQTIPDCQFHITGSAPNAELRARIEQDERIVLHVGGTDRALIEARCRVMIEPLLHEYHVDAKLINAMARGIPVVTTRQALSRAHTDLASGVLTADSREKMVVAIHQLMTDSRRWSAQSRVAADIARSQLASFDRVHRVRRTLAEWQHRRGH